MEGVSSKKSSVCLMKESNSEVASVEECSSVSLCFFDLGERRSLLSCSGSREEEDEDDEDDDEDKPASVLVSFPDPDFEEEEEETFPASLKRIDLAGSEIPPQKVGSLSSLVLIWSTK
jgi:hypothetical protein